MALDATVLAALLQSCAPSVAPATMLAVIRVESQGDPFKIGINAGGRLRAQPTNAADAIATVRGLLRRGANFDAGLMQINSANFRRLGLTAETVFDPCANLRAGARVLADNYVRARNAGHADPLRAALSEYNTGSRFRGVSNGYVGRVYSAAAMGNAPFPAPRPAALPGANGALTPSTVGQILLAAFGGRITDTLRPMNAAYGAQNSFHKYGQAVDFVPRGGVGAITRAQVRALMSANGIRIVELLGPGDPGHADHWHVAFAKDLSSPISPSSDAQPTWTVAATSQGETEASQPTSAVRFEASYTPGTQISDAAPVADLPPPAWDVFGAAAWQRRQSGRGL